MTLAVEMRRLVGAGTAEYSIAGSAYWTDTQLADELARQTSLRPRLLWQVPHYGTNGIEYTRFQLPGSLFVEAGTAGTAGTITTAGGGSVSGWNVDRNGLVTFDSSQGAVTLYAMIPEVDLYGAAANVCDDWATHIKDAFNFSADGQSFFRAAKYDHLRERASQLRKRSGPKLGC